MTVNVHGTCVVLADAGARFDAPRDAGVLLLGPSGAGKSDLALRLIADGAVLVADDRTDLSVNNGVLIGAPAKALAGLLEVRNLGIIPVPHCARARIALAVDLTSDHAPARLPETERWTPPAALELGESACPPLIRLNPFEISTPVKVVLAAAVLAHPTFGKDIAAI